jgi:hypothetical protein
MPIGGDSLSWLNTARPHRMTFKTLVRSEQLGKGERIRIRHVFVKVFIKPECSRIEKPR